MAAEPSIDAPTLAREAAEQMQRTGRPLVTLSYAQTIDGSIALVRGRPAALSGPESRRFTHGLRAAHQAVLVGIGTVLADDPLLTVRLASGPDPQPVVLDARLRFPPEARLLRENPRAPWIFTSPTSRGSLRTELSRRGVPVIEAPADPEGRLDLRAVLAALGERGIASLMVEGGAGVITSFLRERLVDRVAITLVPVFAGGLRAVESLGRTQMADLPRVTETRIIEAGDDRVFVGRIAASDS